MTEYTATNGVKVISERQALSGSFRIRFETKEIGRIVDLSGAERAALVEAIDAERDAELGRWRWPENPGYVVYPWPLDLARRDVRGVTVLNERIPRRYTVWEDRVDTFYGESTDEASRRLARDAARAYFDAHPEPKPWHDAKPGEVWVVQTENVADEVAARVAEVNDAVVFEYVRSLTKFPVIDPRFVSGRRIWPEVQP